MNKTNLFYCIATVGVFSWRETIQDIAGLVVAVTLIWLIVSFVTSLATKKPIWNKSLKVALLIMLISAIFLILFALFTNTLAVKATC